MLEYMIIRKDRATS